MRREGAGALDLLVAVGIALTCPFAETPRRVLALAAVQEEERDRRFLGHAEKALEQLERRLVGRMQILEDETKRHVLRELAGPLEEELERPVLNALAVELAQPLRCIGLEREAEEAGKERVRLVGVLGAEELRQLGPELEANTGLGGGRAHAEPLAQQVADGPVRKMSVGRRAALDEPHAVAITAAHFEHEARFSDAGLAHDRNDGAAPSTSASIVRSTTVSSNSRPISAVFGSGVSSSRRR